MERVQEELGTVEVYENDIDFYLHQFQEKHNIEDMSKASQQKWIACLMDIQKKVSFYQLLVIKVFLALMM